jgi:hypothetical protein
MASPFAFFVSAVWDFYLTRSKVLIALRSMGSEPPEIRFLQIVRSTGMQTIEDALKRTRAGST